MSWQEVLASYEWEDGKQIELPPNSYRHAVVVICSEHGRNTATFANGVHKYFAVAALVRPDATRIMEGNNIVPVLPDGRLLMVIEQRPMLSFYQDHPRIIETEKGTIDLGVQGSLEFPGGAIDNESVTGAFLRELVEETGVGEQTALLYRRVPPIYPMGSDLILRMYFSVLYLSSLSFPDRVENDGGLGVVVLTPDEVEENIRRGFIASRQAGVLGWYLYREVKLARDYPQLLQDFIQDGYLAVQEVKIKK